MILLASLMLLTVVSLCAVLAYRANLEHQQTLAWMRLLSTNLGLSSLAIAEPRELESSKPPEPRRVHKMSVPVPLGGMNREKATSAIAAAAGATRAQ